MRNDKNGRFEETVAETVAEENADWREKTHKKGPGILGSFVHLIGVLGKTVQIILFHVKNGVDDFDHFAHFVMMGRHQKSIEENGCWQEERGIVSELG